MDESDRAIESADRDRHLSQIATRWSMLVDAHRGTAEISNQAQSRLISRYGAAIYRYLIASIRDPGVADDLLQEFALRLARGDFRRADPGRGRFRDFLKTSLYHLIVDHQRRQQRNMVPLGPDSLSDSIPSGPEVRGDEEFLAAWRAELMRRTWEELLKWERQTGQPLHTVLRYRLEHLAASSAEMAAALGDKLGKTVNDNWVRKRLYLAREKFSEILLDEVAGSLENPTRDDLEQELIELNLHRYCRSKLDGRSS